MACVIHNEQIVISVMLAYMLEDLEVEIYLRMVIFDACDRDPIAKIGENALQSLDLGIVSVLAFYFHGSKLHLLIVALSKIIDAFIPTEYENFDFAVSVRYVELVIGYLLEQGSPCRFTFQFFCVITRAQ